MTTWDRGRFDAWAAWRAYLAACLPTSPSCFWTDPKLGRRELSKNGGSVLIELCRVKAEFRLRTANLMVLCLIPTPHRCRNMLPLSPPASEALPMAGSAPSD